jgi:3-deoxy-manno-octulosonate cytidylyltransferase (CMP-KDO synthetase)
MKFWAVVPSRYASTRFPAKPLALIAGQPLLQRVVQQIRKVSGLEDIIVATDHPDIENLCRKIGVKSMMTDSDLPSGTDRVCSAVARSGIMDRDAVIINIQGDEPLIPPHWIEGIMDFFKKYPETEILTLAHPLTSEELENPNSVKVIVNQKNQAIYFSRFPIPHSREKMTPPLSMKHVGIYAYRLKTLMTFCGAPVSALEKAESLEQLRAMDMGIPIHVMKVEGSIQGVDVPDDVEKVEKILNQVGSDK